MRHHTPKRASIESRYRENKKKRWKIMIEDQGYISCEGCGTSQPPIDCSHHVRRSFDSSLIDDPDNIAFMCRSCHLLVESGDYEGLHNGEEIRLYVEANAPEIIVIQSLRKDLGA